MKKRTDDLPDPTVQEVRQVLVETYTPRIARCLKLLSEEEIWWRPNRASNSVGNLVLHLQGNVRQWIISGLGKQTDQRNRAREFAETGSIARRALLSGLHKTVKEADEVLANLRRADILRTYSIQGFSVTGLQAACHVAEHFAFHAGQIIFVTKLKCAKDLKFTKLPAQTKTAGGK